MNKLIIASNNKGKIAEITEILGGRFDIMSMREAGLDVDIDETGATFEENAVIKAEACYKMTGIASLADDSGLEVEALGGAPGVYSAVYAEREGRNTPPALRRAPLLKEGNNNKDDDNIDLLLERMKGIEDRRARFVCVMALCGGGEIILGKGEVAGEILTERAGIGGFGYDPVFLSHELGISFGVAAAGDKNKVSHRRRAIEDLLGKL